MLNVVIVAIIVCTAIWVYLDATKNKIGKIKEAGGMFNMSAGAWSVVTLLLWIIGFPAYLIKRGALIERAKENPVEVKGRGGKTAVLGIIGGLWVLLALVGHLLGSLPACDSPEVVDLATRLIKEDPLVKLSGRDVKGISIPAEVRYDASTKTRICRAQLIYALGEELINYSVQWHDKTKGIIRVQINAE